MKKNISRAGLTDPVLAVGVPIYIVWLTSTVWRAAVSEQWLMFLGAAIFMVGDSRLPAVTKIIQQLIFVLEKVIHNSRSAIA